MSEWIHAGDPEAGDAIISVAGRLLGYCAALNKEENAVEVLRCQPVASDAWPKPVLTPDRCEFARDRLKLPLEYPSEKPKQWIMWTGEEWIDQQSHAVEGPLPEVMA